MRRKIPAVLSWRLARHNVHEADPQKWISATVPGAVQLDWARAHGWPEYWRAESFRAYDGLEDFYWTYETRFRAPALAAHENLLFVCSGIDYACEITLNDKAIYRHEGMFASVELALNDILLGDAENTLRVIIYPAPKSAPTPEDRTQANRSCKPAMSYGWDFHPRLIPLGIWQDAFLEIRPTCHLHEVTVDYALATDFSRTDLSATIHLSAPIPAGACIRWTLRRPDGGVIFCDKDKVDLAKTNGAITAIALRRAVVNPALWWPHDHGEPALHTSTIELLDADEKLIDTRMQRIGFRRVQLVMAPGQWFWSDEFPKTRSLPPITLEINGRGIFAKGANWISPSIFPGVLDRETSDALLGLARGAHMNLLRLWGGAPAQKEFFYERCDELGVMVWQEFPLACNRYPDDPAYLRVLDTESRALIARLKPHACIALWCGGNELFNHWSGMTDQALPLRLLASNCYQLDPSRPFLPTSPIDGVGHGHYVFRDPKTGDEAWSLFQNARCTAYTEFGVPAPASVEILREIIPENELFPPIHGGSWEAHHGLGMWTSGSHLYPETLEHYFGISRNLDELVERGQLLQSEGLKGLYEEARRQKPRASMALCWCFNEPWPAAANLSVVSWPARPKPALAAIRNACRPLLASARIKKFEWRAGELFEAQLWWLNDLAENNKVKNPGAIEPRIETDCGQVFTLPAWHCDGPLSANANCVGPVLKWSIPPAGAADTANAGGRRGRFALVLETPGHPEAASRYILLIALNKG